MMMILVAPAPHGAREERKKKMKKKMIVASPAALRTFPTAAARDASEHFDAPPHLIFG